jgi:pimeloyl-ACP methyl ester carboxylesterase
VRVEQRVEVSVAATEDEPGGLEPVALEYTSEGSGPPVVLLPGTGYAGSTWPRTLIETLSAEFRVISPDYRGTGRTPGTDGDYSTRLFAADVIALLRSLGLERVHVLGHSMGGRVAQWVALDGGPLVRSLVLASSGAGAGAKDHVQVAGVPVDTCVSLVERGYEGHMRALIGRTFFTPEFVAREPATVEWLVQAFWSARPQLRDYVKHVVARQAHRTADRLREIAQPTLVLIGDRDTHVGGTGSHLDQSRFLAERLPDARLELIEETAHGYFWQVPERSAEAVARFLRGH